MSIQNKDYEEWHINIDIYKAEYRNLIIKFEQNNRYSIITFLLNKSLYPSVINFTKSDITIFIKLGEEMVLLAENTLLIGIQDVNWINKYN